MQILTIPARQAGTLEHLLDREHALAELIAEDVRLGPEIVAVRILPRARAEDPRRALRERHDTRPVRLRFFRRSEQLGVSPSCSPSHHCSPSSSPARRSDPGLRSLIRFQRETRDVPAPACRKIHGCARLAPRSTSSRRCCSSTSGAAATERMSRKWSNRRQHERSSTSPSGDLFIDATDGSGLSFTHFNGMSR